VFLNGVPSISRGHQKKRGKASAFPHFFASGGQGKEGSWEAEKIGSWEKEVRGNDIAWLHGCMVAWSHGRMVAWISLGL
jgi:hypothetical protein